MAASCSAYLNINDFTPQKVIYFLFFFIFRMRISSVGMLHFHTSTFSSVEIDSTRLFSWTYWELSTTHTENQCSSSYVCSVSGSSHGIRYLHYYFISTPHILFLSEGPKPEGPTEMEDMFGFLHFRCSAYFKSL